MMNIQPYQTQSPVSQPNVPMALSADVAAEIQSVQAQVVLAKQFPRHEKTARDRVLNQCADVKLAERATYAFKRGGQIISGPSIRLAETMARSWGNLSFGVKQISQNNERTVMKAYCWDLETNVKEELDFIVEHIRFTRKGTTKLHDPRDIYEACMNQGSRRLRKCILGMLPGDFVDSAVEACQKTIATAGDLQNRVAAMVKEFAKWKVTPELIEMRLGHSLKAITGPEFVQLRQIYQSLKDDASKPEDWFEFPNDPKKVQEMIDEEQKETDAKIADEHLKVARQSFMKVYQQVMNKGLKPDQLLNIKNVDEVLNLKEPEKIGIYEDVLRERLCV